MSMKIAIDCDGVMRDIYTKMCDVYNNAMYMERHRYKTIFDIKTWNLKECFSYVDPNKFFFSDNVGAIYIDSKPMKGLLEFFEFCDQEKITLSVHSVQPTPLRRELTFQWLKLYLPKGTQIHFYDTHDQKIEGVRPHDLVIDDCEEILSALPIRTAVCFDRPWNQNFCGFSVKSFNELQNLVRRLI